MTEERLTVLRKYVEWQRERPDLMDGTNVAAVLLDEVDALRARVAQLLGIRVDALDHTYTFR